MSTQSITMSDLSANFLALTGTRRTALGGGVNLRAGSVYQDRQRLAAIQQALTDCSAHNTRPMNPISGFDTREPTRFRSCPVHGMTRFGSVSEIAGTNVISINATKIAR